jgi:hypothetical protein
MSQLRGILWGISAGATSQFMKFYVIEYERGPILFVEVAKHCAKFADRCHLLNKQKMTQELPGTHQNTRNSVQKLRIVWNYELS